ncbi:MAG TPA: AAA family ATPase, partial [Pseudomonadota bacterium]|nr:AAA family ATPase [Pseudomonadota bacterium]
LASLTAEVTVQRDGALLVTLLHPHLSSATDLARQAARCALLLHARLPQAHFAICTGTGLLTQHAPEGSAVDAALEMVQHADASASQQATIFIDSLTENLLGGYFAVKQASDGKPSQLLHEVRTVEAGFAPSGKKLACIGRDSELAMLDGVFAACRDDSVARGALVIGPPGIGKTRLRREFLQRLQTRDEPFLALIGAGDPLNVGESYGLLGQAVRRLSGIAERELLSINPSPHVDRRQLLATWLAQEAPELNQAQALFCLCELCGIPQPTGKESAHEPDADNPVGGLDPREHSQLVLETWLDLLRTLCATRPVLIVLEDLQWGDQPTVRLIDAALRELRDTPLMVLALGRPELRDAFPSLWNGRDVLELRLGGLSRRAAERLLDQLAKGAGVPPLGAAEREQLLSFAAGNALFLEELFRSRLTGGNDRAPETVLAMLQARLNRIDNAARRTLRAASLFGERFVRSGVAHLLGHKVSAAALSRSLKQLVEAELLEPQRDSNQPGDEEFVFRHPLLPRAVQAMLLEDERESLLPLVEEFRRKAARKAQG